MWAFPKIGVPKKWMIYHGKPYEQMDDLGGKPTIFGNIHVLMKGPAGSNPLGFGPPEQCIKTLGGDIP